MRGLPLAVRPWTPAEDEYIREFYGQVTCRELAEALDRTIGSVDLHARRILGLRPRDGEIARNAESRDHAEQNNQPWTTTEHEFVAETLDEPVADVAACLGRTIFAVQARRHLIISGRPMPQAGVSRQLPPAAPPLAQPTCPRCTLQHRGEC